jgi:hypothetical protein
VWAVTRRQWLVLTPEEWVRRNLVAYLTTCCGVDPLCVVEEYPVQLNGQPQRADVVVMCEGAKPRMLIECKAPEVELDQQVFAQAVRYNAVVGALYLMLTNGLRHYCFELRDGQYQQLKSLPFL